MARDCGSTLPTASTPSPCAFPSTPFILTASALSSTLKRTSSPGAWPPFASTPLPCWSFPPAPSATPRPRSATRSIFLSKNVRFTPKRHETSKAWAMGLQAFASLLTEYGDITILDLDSHEQKGVRKRQPERVRGSRRAECGRALRQGTACFQDRQAHERARIETGRGGRS